MFTKVKKKKSKPPQNMPNFVTSATLFADISKLKMVEISRRRKFVRKNQLSTRFVLPFTYVRQNGCRNRETTDA